MLGLALGLSLGLGVPIALVAGLIIGYTLSRKYFKKQLKENPPITEAQIRMMYQQMGRKPTEKQVKQIMANFKKNTK
ncbi:YneF family protein [Malacoplasma iowae]|uniref:YneF family protein n=1 Tax=Malacoplasma iowae TaxID=2116 RepID=UPI002A18928D|nr:YneF family protein [Malacoplasma iowae]WPL39497.1 YneF family protein [Malacoplasma iowae]